MSDLRSMPDPELGDALQRLGGVLAWPTPPDLAPAVAATIRDELASPSLVVPRLSLPSRRRTVFVLVAVLLALAGVALAARAVFEIGAVTVRVVPGPAVGLPTDVLAPEDLGREVPLARAETIAGFRVALPDALGPPARVWVDETVIDLESGEVARRIVTAWEPSADLPEIPRTQAGALLMQFEGEWEVAAKQLFAETDRYGEVIVDGRPAFWTKGAHTLTLVTGDRTTRRLVTGNVVIWQDAGFTFRLETSLPRAEAVALAETIEPAIDLG